MRSYLFLLFYLWTSISFAQTLNGVINLQNSQGEYVSAAEISLPLVDQTLQTRSDQTGKFSIDLEALPEKSTSHNAETRSLPLTEAKRMSLVPFPPAPIAAKFN